jgi:hypothetical protein
MAVTGLRRPTAVIAVLLTTTAEFAVVWVHGSGQVGDPGGVREKGRFRHYREY